MEAKATQNFVRISPRKVKIDLDLIRGKDDAVASGILKNTRKAACEPLEKLLDRVVADAQNNFHMDAEKLYVSACYVTPGMTMKRMMPRGKGSGDRILKRTSHITLSVKEKE